MQFKASFAVLLASILFASPELGVDAAPSPLKRGTGTITLPLRRIEQTRSNVHPLINLQQHINRGSRRLARMTGRELPTDEELVESLRKRVLSLEDTERVSKRYNRIGLPNASKSQKLANLAEHRLHHSHNSTASAGAASNGTDNGSTNGKGNGAGNGKGNGAGNGKGKDVANGNANGANNGTHTGAGNGKGNGAGNGKGNKGNGNANGANNGTATGATNGTDTGAGNGKGNGAGTGNGNSANNGTATGATNGTDTGATNDSGVGQNDGVTVANQPSTANSLGLDIEANDVSYLATIQMGTPPRDFLLLMDSGSADMWVGSENCQSEAGGDCGDHQLLGTGSSSSFQEAGRNFQVTYGTGNVAGTVITDDVSVAGLALKGHTFGVADQESVEFSDNSVPFDGLMGLAQSTLSEQQTLTPIEALAKAGLVKAAITSYKIPRLADGKNDGEITFGDVDTTKFDQQTLVTVDNVSQDGFWEGSMDAVTVDGQDAGLQGRTAILDTGTTLIIAPEQDATAVHQLIEGSKSDGQGGFTVPCNTKAAVALSFGGTEFAIDPRDLAFQPLDPQNPNGDCISGIAAGNIGGANEWLVGDVFLKNAYFSTDVDKNTLSLAKLV